MRLTSAAFGEVRDVAIAYTEPSSRSVVVASILSEDGGDAEDIAMARCERMERLRIAVPDT